VVLEGIKRRESCGGIGSNRRWDSSWELSYELCIPPTKENKARKEGKGRTWAMVGTN
jgi:hypothetical protein